MKNRQSRQESTVQGTNDSSIVSKHSMVTQGYIADPYLDEVVKQPCRRDPLINRGYYIRSLAINNVYKTFLQQYSGQLSQIVCLGAGYDTAFYRFFKAGLLAHCHYYEVDFDTVLSHKKDLIETSPLLSDCVSEVDKLDDCTYKLVACDLKEPEQLTALLGEAGVDWSVPTLLVAECVLAYLTSEQSAKVINWAGSHFANAVLAVYEQTHPSDPFGEIMVQHFRELGSPIEVACSTPELHVGRLLENSWPAACCHTALDCYQALVSEAELHRISSLEPFDEFEEWHLMAQHYVLASGYKGSCTEIPCFKNRCSRHFNAAPRAQKEKGAVRCFPVASAASSSSNTTTHVERFAHSSVVTYDSAGGEVLVVVGGFGVLPSSQQSQPQQINTVDIFQLSASEDKSDSLISMERNPVLLDGIVPDNNMFIRSVGLSATDILLFEGRSSPAKRGSLVHRLSVSTAPPATEPASVLGMPQAHEADGANDEPAFSDSDGELLITDSIAQSPTADTDDRALQLCCRCSELLCSGTPPCPRWRYTVTPCTVQARSTVVAFGGRTPDSVCLADTYTLDIKCAAWTKLQITSNFSPSRRHSHSASLWKDRKIVISGGLNDAERLCADAYWLMDISPGKEVQWSKLCFDPPLPPRYSHSSHILGDTLILVGGVTSGSAHPSIILADLCGRKWLELALQTSTGEPLLLHNHTSHVLRRPSSPHPVLLLVGGGGTCFSFGTRFNSGPYALELATLKWIIVSFGARGQPRGDSKAELV